MNWFRRKSYPEFWQRYQSHFNTPQEQNLNAIRFVVFDTETTGLNTDSDKILSIGCVTVYDMKIKISDQLELYLKQHQFNPKTVKIHGLLKEGFVSKVDEETAIIHFLHFVRNAVLVAHHAAFDLAMINAALKRMQLPKLKNKVLDTGHLFIKTSRNSSKTHFSLDNLAQDFKIPLHDRHTASGDAYITAILFLKLISILNKNDDLTLKDLLRSHTRIGLL